MTRFGFWAGAAASIAAAACQPDARVWQPSAPIEIEQPAHFGSRATWSEGMTPTHASVALGELLFNDEELSADGSISCATCHQSQAAFSDLGARLSVGVYNRLGRRNTPPIQNVLWMPFFMWDGGITNLEVMPMAPITNYAEHDLNLWEFVRRAELRYPEEIYRAFGTDSATSQLVMRALAHYMMTLVSANAPIDQVARGERIWTASELEGKVVFDRHCADCHAGPLQTSWGFGYHGTPPAVPADSGRYKVSLNPAEMGFLRIPSLRNWAFTSPYMHDGRYATLGDVLADWEQATGNNFNVAEREALIHFLHTFNDSTYVE